MAATAGANASHSTGAGAPTSRRSTRIAGTRASCNNGGNAKPANKVIAVKNPSASGPQPAAGKSVCNKPRNKRSSHSCAPKPNAAPSITATMPMAHNCSKLTASVKLRVAPKVFMSATASRCRCT